MAQSKEYCSSTIRKQEKKYARMAQWLPRKFGELISERIRRFKSCSGRLALNLPHQESSIRSCSNTRVGERRGSNPAPGVEPAYIFMKLKLEVASEGKSQDILIFDVVMAPDIISQSKN